MNEKLKNPTVEIDGEEIEIIPNKFVYASGSKPICSFCGRYNDEYLSIKRADEQHTICIICIDSIQHALKLRQDQVWRARRKEYA